MDPNNSHTPKTSKYTRINPDPKGKPPRIAKSKLAASVHMAPELNVTGFQGWENFQFCIKSDVKLKAREKRQNKKCREIERKKNIEGGHRKHALT
ncbi:hypothetical protein VNO78_03197 [Psophocarpus tetragonolobus]|uniref:Uncharacterized protein n=1 Tax=Psophocarpus tetragonolobus TaxID=3891 RepID=A0AAN9T2N9_PSOTE